MESPLVTVVVLCHNQSPYVLEAVHSVLNQSYPSIEIIIVDDGSLDGSKEIIQEFIKHHDLINYINIERSIGNCAAFNRGWQESSGKFLIDLAADDMLMPDRVEVGVQNLIETNAGVHFSDAILIDKDGRNLGRHNDRFQGTIPEGNLYIDLVSRYLVCPPTMMIRREVFDYLNGYDESLTYEDFDFWVRSAREFEYSFTNQALVKKRLVHQSHGRSQENFRNRHQRSTLEVCKKVLSMNQSKEEGTALRKRCWHEIVQCIKKGNLRLIPDYLFILRKC